MDDMLECPICHDVFEVVVEIACCHQCFCKACIEGWIARQHTCPGCRAPVSHANLAPNYPLQRLVDKTECACPHEEHGCKARVGRGELQRHAQLCEYAVVPCSCYEAAEAEAAERGSAEAASSSGGAPRGGAVGDAAGGEAAAVHSEAAAAAAEEEGEEMRPPRCADLPRIQQAPHERDECPFRIVPCVHDECTATGLRHWTLPRHLRSSCPYEPAPCDLCGQRVARRLLPDHRADECPLAEQPCPYADFGCEAPEMAKAAMRAHIEEQAVAHAELMKRSLKEERELTVSMTQSEMDVLHHQVRELTEAVAALSALKPHLPHAPLNNRHCVLPSTVRKVKSDLVTVTEQGDVVAIEYSQPFIRIFSRSASQPSQAELVYSNRPIPSLRDGIFFFELTVANPGVNGVVGIGLARLSDAHAHKNPPLMPGWDEQSCGYHADDGRKYGPGCVGHGASYGPVFGRGDTVGCGFHLSSGSVFFTKNDMFLGVAFEDFPRDELLYGVVGLHSGGTKVVVNFGARPFRYSLEALEQRLATPAVLARAASSASSPLSVSAPSSQSSPLNGAASRSPARSASPSQSPIRTFTFAPSSAGTNNASRHSPSPSSSPGMAPSSPTHVHFVVDR